MRFSGERMKQIRLQRPVQTRSASGGITQTWADAADDPNPWAHVRDERGDERYQADKKSVIAVRFFQVHMRDDVDETWTILDEDENRRYDIESIFPIGRRKLDIKAIYTQGQYNEPQDEVGVEFLSDDAGVFLTDEINRLLIT